MSKKKNKENVVPFCNCAQKVGVPSNTRGWEGPKAIDTLVEMMLQAKRVHPEQNLKSLLVVKEGIFIFLDNGSILKLTKSDGPTTWDLIGSTPEDDEDALYCCKFK